MENFDWQGRRIAWERAGSGPAVVFCHGTPWSSWLWRPFAEALSGDFTVYLWDMPGYGRSSKDPSHAVDFGVQTEAFAALLTHWGLERPHVVAHDYGGAVSLRAHLFHGVSVRVAAAGRRGGDPAVGIAVLPAGQAAPGRAGPRAAVHPRGAGPGVHR
ncbi:alpha/beta fold hydrolase [Amycolatopsis sp. cmx-8-4]|uniref:alpha/beta fold hydrolase n=1 Tax=Amycolatopsis sp. cmx-8-4 TaxID=2790947 RepID=UPI003978F75A